MKSFLFLVLCLFATSVEAKQIEVFGNTSSALTSSVINVGDYKTKTITMSGRDYTAGTFTTMSGNTVTVQCAPTRSGPWTTCTYKVETPTSITSTANATFTWTDAVQYLRVTYTKVRKGVTVWLGLAE